MPWRLCRPSPSRQPTTREPATPGPKADLPAKAKAYGRHCQDQSKKRSDAAEGTKGTPFSQCVTAMAKLAKGTPFSRCVVAGAQLLKE